MARFKYIALDAKGQEVEGTIDADNETSALSKIREKNLFPSQVAEVGKGAAVKKTGKAASKKGGLKMELKMPSFLIRVKPKQLMVSTRQLATLVNAGLPLLRGLQVMQRQEKNPALKKALSEIADAIQSGSTFAEALGQHPKIYNKLYVNMARAGELGGVLDQVLVRLAEFMEKAQAIKSKVVSAMIYPVVVLCMAGGILGFLMVFIIPKFEQIFKEMLEGEGLPPLTQFVLNLSRAFTHHLVWVVVSIVVLIVLVRTASKTTWGRLALDRLKISAPVFGTLSKKTAIARFSRTLGTLMTSGVPVLQALNIVRDTAGNEVIARAVSSIHDAVKEGENMSPPIEACGIFPPMVVSMVEVGEETGGLPEMLMRVADTYDGEVDDAVAGMTSIIEPILIIFLAVVVGTIVIALFMPLISIIGQLS